MRRLAYAILVAVIVFTLPACSMKKAVSKMSFELKRVHVTHIDKEGFDATVYIKVNNPNWFSMTVSDFNYKVFIRGTEIAHGESGERLKIPSDGSTVAELPLFVEYGGIKDKMYDLLRGRLEYRVTGEVGFSTWLGRYALPFDTEKKPDKNSDNKVKSQEAEGVGDGS